MTRDWIWGCVAILPGIILGFLVLRLTGVLERTSELIAMTSILCLTALVATGVLWVCNRRSIRKATRSGREIELVIRPLDALARAALLFLSIFGATALLNLLIHGQFDEWQRSVVFSGAMAYSMALMTTAYRKAD